jgi:hypothetical protein
LAKTNISTAITAIHLNCLAVGNGIFLYSIKNKTKQSPPHICRMLAICNAGISVTPILLATQVVPQTIQVIANAMYPFPFPSIVFNDRIVFIVKLQQAIASIYS